MANDLLKDDINYAINIMLSPSIFDLYCKNFSHELTLTLTTLFLREYAYKMKREDKIKNAIKSLILDGYTTDEIVNYSILSLGDQFETVIPIYFKVKKVNKPEILSDLSVMKVALEALNSKQLQPLILSLKNANTVDPSA